MLTSEVLNKAADLIEERGWRVGSGMEVSNRPLCIEAAVSAAQDHKISVTGGVVQWAYLTSRPSGAGGALMAYLEQRPYLWNDAPGRTASEVIEVLRATALIEAAKENTETRQAVSA